MDMSVIELADRVRMRLNRPGITEKKMFGGIAFMLDGNMICGVMKGGAIIVRVGKDGMDDALSRPGAQPTKMGARTMNGFVDVSGDAIEDDDALDHWISAATAYASSLPPK